MTHKEREREKKLMIEQLDISTEAHAVTTKHWREWKAGFPQNKDINLLTF